MSTTTANDGLALGIDFGTTNSAIAVAERGRPARVLPLPAPGGGTVSYWRTVLCFEPSEDRTPMRSSAGAEAIARYAQSEGIARLLQSIKSHLASGVFVDTSIFGKRFKLEHLIGVYLRAMRAAAPVDLGRRAVVGRPVRYWGAESAADDERAVGRMREALALAGFDDVTFAYEPVAAAHAYAARLDHDELVLIADFGGGTSDFSVVAVGPRAGAKVWATSGVAIAGDAFDARVIDQVVAPRLGKGSRYRVELGGEAGVPSWIYNALRRWHHLSTLKSAETTRLLERIAAGAIDRDAIARLLHVVEDDLGLPLHASVEAAKVALSRAGEAAFDFARPGVIIRDRIARDAFDAWIEPDLAAIDDAVTAALTTAGVAAGDIDRVFATGGSSLVPAVRGRLAARFGADRLVGGEELTSVAAGLASMAALG
ncbi:MAG TPA: Hsp70 family protein [Kofleriaceae bacterium]|nr:Hsp70 family protein [Kofleriaceae bacterium]